MQNADFLRLAHADHVRIRLTDGQTFTGRFRTDILTPTAVSAYFHGDQRDLSLALEQIASLEVLAGESLAS